VPSRPERDTIGRARAYGGRYLAQLLEAKGDAAGAAAERAVAADIQRFDIDIPALAQSDFWVDPVQGGIKRHH